ncbi:DUF2125 domain-containing protein [Paracoccus sp. (in: a-proteobacteria)]|uniref:DUF2125 domain-containing protein n=1 Tax=Paracoccus sp. TaxID=267 RepID=UPI0026E095B1|nr:DUF2125 domain-containing protein [Paracoccus sp. (in: a-proteobacteria)]MDO5647028.1 DUF2125 domain-containing protein [Paracoccus sp. (in: a-proteobacteria)]
MFRTLSTSGLALIIGAGAVFADVTPAQVWDNMQRAYVDQGYAVTVGGQDIAGDVLTVNNVVLALPTEDHSRADITIPRIVFRQDGATVRSIAEGDILMALRATDDDDQETGIDVVLTMPGNETVSSGTPDDMRHDFTVPTTTLAARMTDTTNPTPVTGTMTNLTGWHHVTKTAAGTEQTSEMAADSLDLRMAMTMDRDEDESHEGELDTLTANLTITGLTGTTAGATPEGADFNEAPGQALRDGMAVDATLGFASLTGRFDMTGTDEDGETTAANGEFSGGEMALTLKMSADGLYYGSTGRDGRVTLNVPDMPVIDYRIAETAFGLTMPMLAAEQPQNFALTYALKGVELGQGVWTLFDAESKLPRDPLNLTIDLSGQATMKADLTDLADHEDVPATLHSLDVNKVALDGAGASANVTGALTFGEDLTAPTGTINGQFSGVNELVNTLVAMGLIPQDQAMGARMMIAMFARPVDGQADVLATEFEFRDDGSIFANGQQIQ